MTGAEIFDFEFVQVVVKGNDSMPLVYTGGLQSHKKTSHKTWLTTYQWIS
jgi:hypothetical protein